MRDIDNKAINSIRFLGVDMINQANSGHPGIVLGAAPMIYTLFTKHLNIYPKKNNWINRDRFVLSAGHGSALLYSINHLVGYDISIDDLKNFRQEGKTPGHPEYGHTDGVDATTGPLGQGIGNAVGMAIAEAHLSARFNKDDLRIVDHYTYVLCGDGDLQEGISMEAMSLAGRLGLGKLIVLFDSNDIQLDGPVNLAYTDNNKKKMESMGWQHILVDDGNDINKINRAIQKAKRENNKPTIIEVKTIIGFGSDVAGTSKVHGSPLGVEKTNVLRDNLSWKSLPYSIDNDVYALYKNKTYNRGRRLFNKWNQGLSLYKDKFQSDYDLFMSFISDKVNDDIDGLEEILSINSLSTRASGGKLLYQFSQKNLNIIGGSADLTSSTMAKGNDGNFDINNRLGRNINFGVREHAMGAIVNGITLHGGLKAFSGGFFVFSDYMKPAIRMAALMSIPSIFVFTHDSIAVGEDGPTHQPIEQLAGLRAIPNLNVIRPADSKEAYAAWKIALHSKKTPTAIILTRQAVDNTLQTNADNTQKGAYILESSNANSKIDGTILACGSELSLAVDVANRLKEIGKNVQVVSIPSPYLFDKQPINYKKTILNGNVMAIEMGSTQSWYKYTKNVFGIDAFGMSDNASKVIEKYGFNVDNLKEFYLNSK